MVGHETCFGVSSGSWYYQNSHLGHYSTLSGSSGGHSRTRWYTPYMCHCQVSQLNMCPWQIPSIFFLSFFTAVEWARRSPEQWLPRLCSAMVHCGGAWGSIVASPRSTGSGDWLKEAERWRMKNKKKQKEKRKEEGGFEVCHGHMFKWLMWQCHVCGGRRCVRLWAPNELFNTI